MIIAFAGRKQSGKTTSAEFLKKEYEKHNDYSMAKIYNFADTLKEMCINVFGISHNQCYGTDEQKNQLVDCLWPDTDICMSAREVLQYVGTDVFRKMQHNVWANATMRSIIADRHALAIIADCRFPNEVETVKNFDGLVIKLHRNVYHSDHASEIALDENKYDHNNFDLIIDNSNITEEEKNKMILNFLKHKRVLPL
jgi:hypothetical protein